MTEGRVDGEQDYGDINIYSAKTYSLYKTGQESKHRKEGKKYGDKD